MATVDDGIAAGTVCSILRSNGLNAEIWEFDDLLTIEFPAANDDVCVLAVNPLLSSCPDFSEEEILTIRRLLAVVALSPEAYALSGRLSDEYGDLDDENVFFYKIGKDRSGERAVVPANKE